MKLIYFIPIIFIFSIVFSSFIVLSIKYYLAKHVNLFFPTNLEELKLLTEGIINCYNNNKIIIHIFHMTCFVFLQTWCIPGTVFFNLFAGAVFGIYLGTFLCLIFNTLGAFFSYSISRIFLREVFDTFTFLKENKMKLENIIETHQDNLLYYLIFLRLFPGSPNWLMNITFPHINIKPLSFVITVFFGIAPWNFFSCSAGAILGEITTTNQIMSGEKYLLLIMLALCILLIPKFKSTALNYLNEDKKLHKLK